MKFAIKWSEYLPSANRQLSVRGIRVLCEGETLIMAESEAEAYEAMKLAFPSIKLKEDGQ